MVESRSMTSWSDPGPAPRAHARRSASREHRVELTDVAEGEGPQECAQGGGRHHPVTEDRPGGARTEHVGVIDVGPARGHGVHQGEHFASRKRPTDTTREVERWR